MVHIIGIGINGKEGISNKALEVIKGADILFGGERHLGYFPDFKGERFVIKSNLKEAVAHIKQNKYKKISVLASGDPGFYGIADYIIKNLGKDDIEIIPNISSIQWAFAKIKETWHDAEIISSHGHVGRSGENFEKIVKTVACADKIGIFTSSGDEPKKIAETLIRNGLDNFNAYICEDLGSPDENITTCRLKDVASKSFSPLNVMILIRNNVIRPANSSSMEGIFGFPDNLFSHTSGLITKEEIRAISLAKLRLKKDSIIWDIGAGSGSVAIEAGRIAKKGRVYAIEKNPERVQQIKENIKRFVMENVEVVAGEAPDILNGLMEPDSVFIGGSGGSLKMILEVCSERLTDDGHIVVNAVTLDTLKMTTDALKGFGMPFEIISVNIAKSKDISDSIFFEAQNPVYIISGEKNG